jgi:quercetin dioxygenase-like cupin family protein
VQKVRCPPWFGFARREPVFRRQYAGQRQRPHMGAGAASAAEGRSDRGLSGDPSKDGLYVLRLKVPANYKIPAHNHPTAEYVTVISGKFRIGMGDKLDEKKGIELRAGGFGAAPAHMNHYAWASEDTVVQVHGQGPFAMTYVNPADDPSK